MLWTLTGLEAESWKDFSVLRWVLLLQTSVSFRAHMLYDVQDEKLGRQSVLDTHTAAAAPQWHFPPNENALSILVYFQNKKKQVKKYQSFYYQDKQSQRPLLNKLHSIKSFRYNIKYCITNLHDSSSQAGTLLCSGRKVMNCIEHVYSFLFFFTYIKLKRLLCTWIQKPSFNFIVKSFFTTSSRFLGVCLTS